jgi:hypothetical protein
MRTLFINERACLSIISAFVNTHDKNGKNEATTRPEPGCPEVRLRCQELVQLTKQA